MPITGLLYFFVLISSLFIVYFILPEVLLHVLGIGCWRRQYSPGVSLTFDDGPDPVYTPRLLEILAKEHITACFFLIGEKVEQYPDIVNMILREGHLIGSHGYHHRHAWLMSPQKTWELWDKSIATLKKTTGKEPDFIRPPWGAFNLSLVMWCFFKQKRIVSWNAVGKDWKLNRTTSTIVDHIVENTREGTIILLHDSGGEDGAPNNTLSCLPELCAKIKQHRKLPIVPLAFPEWSLLRRLRFRLWEKWEHLYAALNHIRRIDDQNVFRLSLARYRGPDLLGDDGELLASKGDIIGEIHLDNIRFQSAGSNLQNIGIRALKQVRQSLPDVVRHISLDPDFQNVKVYIGVTMLNRGAKGLGFTVQEYPFHNGNMIAILQKTLMLIYHPLGSKRKTEKLGNKPKLVWISKEKLIQKYQESQKEIS